MGLLLKNGGEERRFFGKLVTVLQLRRERESPDADGGRKKKLS